MPYKQMTHLTIQDETQSDALGEKPERRLPINLRQMIDVPLRFCTSLLFASLSILSAQQPNVIFFAVDDMNDWISPMGSNMAQTPNLDRLAKMGVTFTNAHTAGVYCAPSRTAIFTGRYPTSSGCYHNQVYMIEHPEYLPLQAAFRNAGYNTYGAGKLYHHPKGLIDQRGWTEFFIRSQAQKENGWGMDTWDHGAPKPDPLPHGKFNQANPKWKGKPFLEVGPIPNEQEEEIVDTVRTNWICDIISKKHDKPFFAALGLYAPHYPNYAPQRFFDMYPLDSLKIPELKEDDINDLPADRQQYLINRKKAIYDQLIELGGLEEAYQAYLACITYADSNLGRVLDALESSPNKDNTIIVFWSDHGYTLGEKGHWGKHTLWQRTSNVPFLWAGPGIATGKQTNYTATLIDMYPTLLDLCGLEPDSGHDGESLKPVLKQPQTGKNRAVWLAYDEPGSVAVMDQNWHYIQYKDGSEELYDVRGDPNQWHNLAGNTEYNSIMKQMKESGPHNFAPAGTLTQKHKLVIEGESYRWELK